MGKKWRKQNYRKTRTTDQSKGNRSSKTNFLFDENKQGAHIAHVGSLPYFFLLFLLLPEKQLLDWHIED